MEEEELILVTDSFVCPTVFLRNMSR